MKRIYLVGAALVAGCSSTPANNSPPVEAGPGDGTTADANTADVAADSPTEASAADAGDATTSDAGDAGASDAAPDVVTSDVACPAPALPSDDPFTLPVVDGGVVLNDGGVVLLHAVGTGTQDYTCEGTADDGGTSYAWTFVGPQAVLTNCNAQVVAQHFASEAGVAAPEWQAPDGTYVIGAKQAAYTPDGGSGSVAWLVLGATSTGGGDAGTFVGTQYIERLNTDGGVAPSAASCNIEAGTVTQKVPYTADYYFLAQ
jgi:hypothetical protein